MSGRCNPASPLRVAVALTNSTNLRFADTNFLRAGKAVDFGRTADVDRSSTFLDWSDPNVMDSRWTDKLGVAHSSDGNRWNVAVERPFYSLETPFAAGVSLRQIRSVVTRYRLDVPYDGYQRDWRGEHLYYGRLISRVADWSQQLRIGLRTDVTRFGLTSADTLLAGLPLNRRLVYPYVHATIVQDRFATTQDLNQVARTEDVHFVWHAMGRRSRLGHAHGRRGSSRRAVVAAR